MSPNQLIKPLTHEAKRIDLIGVSAGAHPAYQLHSMARRVVEDDTDVRGSLGSSHSAFYAILSCEAWRALSCENPSELSTMLATKAL